MYVMNLGMCAVVKFRKKSHRDRQREREERQTDRVTQSERELWAHLEFQCVGNNKGTSAALVEL